MRPNLLILFTVFCTAVVIGRAQSIQVNPVGAPESSMDAEELTIEVLIEGGACSEISNFQFKDNPMAQYPSANRSWGYFEKGDSAFPFENGIVLTSGYARDAEGPSTGIVSQGNYDWLGDTEANVLASTSTNNATVFEFDFVPYGDHISFNYIFASEEYPGFSCSNYNDVFGFIISGPGIVNDPGLSGKNIALLPSGEWVTINNVNDQYCGDDTYYVPGNFPYIEYGGRTTVLTAESDVIPGETYHIRMLIADALDTSYDSAVFLEAGSFNLGSTLSDIEGTSLGDDKTVCGAEEFTIVVQVEAPSASYQWYKDGVLIPGATAQSYTATEDGYYSVVVVSNECQTEVGVNLEFVDQPETTPYEVLLCTPDGTHTFDLTDYEPFISTTAGVSYSYFNTMFGAINNAPGDLILNYQDYTTGPGTTTVYVRVQTAEVCFEVEELKLTVGFEPDTVPINYELCDDNGDGFMTFDLTTQGPLMVISDPNGLAYEYYLDAATTQLIPEPENFVNTSSPQLIYVKIFNPTAPEGNCLTVETLTLIVNEFPEIQPDSLTICDDLNDSSEFIDLTQNNIVVTPDIDVSLHYYEVIGGPEITNPTNYEVTGSPTVIHVLVRNSDASCEEYQTITINFNSAAEVQNAALTHCSFDDFAEFDLMEAVNQIVADPTGMDIGFYLTFEDARNGNPADALPLNYTNTSNPQTVYARVVNEEGCFNIAEVLLTATNGPEHLPYTEAVCDDNGDGVFVFDLTALAPNLLTGSPANVEYGYFLDEDLTNEITNPATFENTSNPQIIYVRLVNNTDPNLCISIGELTLEVNEFPLIQPYEITLCDNLNDGTEIIDLTQNEIVATPGIQVTLHYYETIGGPEITDPENYQVTSSPTVIHVLVRNSDATCEDYQTITINFNLSPEVTEEIIALENCSLTEYTSFYLPDANQFLVDSPAGLDFTYHLTFDDAFDGLNNLPANYQNISPNQIIFARVLNSDGCFDIGRIQLIAVTTHEELPVIEICDDPYQPNDGKAVFDLTQYHDDIENILDGSEYIVKYFTQLDDALVGNNPISNPSQFVNQTNPQIIYAQATSVTGGCKGIVEFELKVLPVPEFELPEEIKFCKNDIEKIFEFDEAFDSYTWYDPSGNVAGYGPVIDFTTEGIYTLEVTLDELECPARREIDVIYDIPPVITEIKVDGQTVTVLVAGGFGPYKYSIDNGLTWQDFNVFYDMEGGIYEVIVMSKYGCFSEAKMFGVLGIPNFISPNGDGINDVWFVRGLEAYPNTKIQIFDRYGKMFVDRKLETGVVWDGKYMGHVVPSGDYWYIITLEDGRKISGHISVRNQ